MNLTLENHTLLLEFEPLAYWFEFIKHTPSPVKALKELVETNLPARYITLFRQGGSSLERSEKNEAPERREDVDAPQDPFWGNVRTFREIEKMASRNRAYLFWILVLGWKMESKTFLQTLCEEILSRIGLPLNDSELESLLWFMSYLKADPIKLPYLINNLAYFVKRTPQFACHYLERRRKMLKIGKQEVIREFFSVDSYDEAQFNTKVFAAILSDHYQVVNSLNPALSELSDLLEKVTKIFVDLYQLYQEQSMFILPHHRQLGGYILRRLRLQSKKCSPEGKELLRQQRKQLKRVFSAATQDEVTHNMSFRVYFRLEV
jgi:hypothetical protein